MKKILRIPICDVLECIAPIEQRHRIRVLAPNTIPAGSAVLSVHENYACRSFDYTIQHESFESVNPACHLPAIADVTWSEIDVQGACDILERLWWIEYDSLGNTAIFDAIEMALKKLGAAKLPNEEHGGRMAKVKKQPEEAKCAGSS